MNNAQVKQILESYGFEFEYHHDGFGDVWNHPRNKKLEITYNPKDKWIEAATGKSVIFGMEGMSFNEGSLKDNLNTIKKEIA